MFEFTDTASPPRGLLHGTPSVEWSTVLIEQHAAIAQAQFREIDAVTTLYIDHCDEDSRRGKNESVQGEYAHIEVAGTLRITEGAALAMINLGCTLRWRLQRTSALFAAGKIDRAQTNAIAEALANVSDDKLDELERLLIEGAERLTAPKLRTKARRLIARLDPDGARDRRQRAEEDRDVRTYASDDGMSRIDGLLPASGAQVVTMRLREMAMSVCGDDPRTFAQRRADALIALAHGANLLECRCDDTNCRTRGGPDAETGTGSAGTEADGGATAGHAIDAARLPNTGAPTPLPPLPKSTIMVGVNVMTLLGLDDLPGYLAGYAPIDSDLAREVAADGTWRKVLTLSDTDRELILDALAADTLSSGRRSNAHGHILGIGRALVAAGITPATIRNRTRRRREALTYKPSTRLADIVRTRDGTCRFPNCTARAEFCDLDHTVPFDHRNPERGGQTIEQNLACLCRKHHRVKTEGLWKVRQLGAGRLEWTDTHGATTITDPEGPFTSTDATPEHLPFGPLTDSATLRRLFDPDRERGVEADLAYLLDALAPNWRTRKCRTRLPSTVHYTGSTEPLPRPAPF